MNSRIMRIIQSHNGEPVSATWMKYYGTVVVGSSGLTALQHVAGAPEKCVGTGGTASGTCTVRVPET